MVRSGAVGPSIEKLREAIFKDYRQSMLPAWVASSKEAMAKKPERRIAYQTTMCHYELPELSVFSESPEFGSLHICKICNAICRIEPYSSKSIRNGRLVYDPAVLNHLHVCPFNSKQWHDDLSEIVVQIESEGDEDKMMALARKYKNILDMYKKEIAYYNDHDAKDLIDELDSE